MVPNIAHLIYGLLWDYEITPGIFIFRLFVGASVIFVGWLLMGRPRWLRIHSHQWGKWKDGQARGLLRVGERLEPVIIQIQQRECDGCGKKQTRKLHE